MKPGHRASASGILLTMLPTPLIVIAAWLLLAGVVCEVADRKGRPRGDWFVLSVLLSPLLAGALVVALPDPRRRCPACATRCADAAAVCRGCGRALPATPPPAKIDPLFHPRARQSAPLSAAMVAVVWTAVLVSAGVLSFAGWVIATT